MNQYNCERCEDRLKVTDYLDSYFTGFCDGCYEVIQEGIAVRDTQRAALAWLDDTADLDNEGDALAYTVFKNILAGRDVSPVSVKHAAAWLSDSCDLDNESDALAYDFFIEVLN